MARATRTLNPLHFEDLEPHRFEDLIRQLVYDYRPWSSIEATGRGGADDGIDIRAHESAPVLALDPEDLDDPPPPADQQLWVIQCKRERRISPKQLVRYVEESVGTENPPYGSILAAACDFSKKAYDAFRAALVTSSVQEFHLWGKAELEDQLFQPKNDHLLFAYFGVSLQVKRRSRQTELRSTVSWRKRVLKALGDRKHHINHEILVLDAEATDYPYIRHVKDFDQRPQWGIYKVTSLHPQNFLMVELKRQLAYVNPQEGTWDVIEDSDVLVTHARLYGQERAAHDPLAWPRRKAWEAIVPSQHRAYLITFGNLGLERILAIEENGDAVHDLPIFYVQRNVWGNLVQGPEGGYFEMDNRHISSGKVIPSPESRTSVFQDLALRIAGAQQEIEAERARYARGNS